MSEVVFHAFAKINLTLDVLGLRGDGYHNLQMITSPVGLCDDISVTLTDTPVFSIKNNLPYLPCNEKNLALTAARLYLEKTGRTGMGAGIYLHKRIPVAAGLGGGSADAAAVLRGLNELFGDRIAKEELMSWALELGSDVPCCLFGGVALAEGRGELLTPLPPLPDCDIVICRPGIAVSTKEAFKAMETEKIKGRPDLPGIIDGLRRGDLAQIARRMYNVFEPPMTRKISEIGAVHSALIDLGALGACMSGTGAAAFGIFGCSAAAQSAYDKLKREFADTFLVKPKLL